MENPQYKIKYVYHRVFLTKTYLFLPESRKPLANGFLSIFRRVICRTGKINHVKSHYKCQVRSLQRNDGRSTSYSKINSADSIVLLHPISQVFYYLSSKARRKSQKSSRHSSTLKNIPHLYSSSVNKVCFAFNNPRDGYSDGLLRSCPLFDNLSELKFFLLTL